MTRRGVADAAAMRDLLTRGLARLDAMEGAALGHGVCRIMALEAGRPERWTEAAPGSNYCNACASRGRRDRGIPGDVIGRITPLAPFSGGPASGARGGSRRDGAPIMPFIYVLPGNVIRIADPTGQQSLRSRRLAETKKRPDPCLHRELSRHGDHVSRRCQVLHRTVSALSARFV